MAYTHVVIRTAARQVQKWPQFAQDTKVQACEFSAKWIGRWLREVDLRRRKITTTAKHLPPPEQVQASMSAIQEKLKDFELDEIISADETGIIFCQQPLAQFVPPSAERAVAEKADEKARLTAMLWGTAAGKMGPVFAIIKCTSKLADLTNTRVLTSLASVPGFTAADGWTADVWTRELTVMVKHSD